LWDVAARVYPDDVVVPVGEALRLKPAAKRRWGYFALPILYGDRLVGKLDATAERKAGVLQVNAIHQDVPFNNTMTSAVHREITDLARWLDLELALPA
jgi:uncharacterized protein YcaQ